LWFSKRGYPPRPAEGVRGGGKGERGVIGVVDTTTCRMQKKPLVPIEMRKGWGTARKEQNLEPKREKGKAA